MSSRLRTNNLVKRLIGLLLGGSITKSWEPEGYRGQWSDGFVYFVVHSWSWDGKIDEAYLAGKLTQGADLSDPLPPELRKLHPATWAQEQAQRNKEPEPQPPWSKRLLMWFLDTVVGGVLGAIGAVAVIFIFFGLLAIPVGLLAWLISTLARSLR